ncbi:kinase-like domain-containing protein [Cunninghamella echinulata]|nr:kinase-like domain-containing protein [Cunninghamella echinulata]
MGAVCCTPEEIDFGKEVELCHFYLLKVIGKGAFGKVRIVQHRLTGREYALKYISKPKCIELKATHNIIAERQLLGKIEHPLIVNMRYAFQDQANLFMVLDLMLGGDLRFLLDRYGKLGEMQARYYVADLICALEYLHTRRIAHRDIKPDNILLDEKGHAHLSDFNIATHFHSKRPKRYSRAGSLAYMAPEILNKEGYDTSIDWWSLGATTFELIFGKRPFSGKSNEDLTNSILNDPVKFPENTLEIISQNCYDVLQGFLTKSPEERLGCGKNGIKKLKSHPWFDGIDWTALVNKTAIPPFKPNPEESHFDAVHELEELLLEEVPLRPHKRTAKTSMESSQPETEDDRHRNWMDEMFLPFDYTKCHKSKKKNESLESDRDTDVDVPIDPKLAIFQQESAIASIDEPSGTNNNINNGNNNNDTGNNIGLAGTRLLRRVGNALEHIEQSKYKAKGYSLTPSREDDPFFDDLHKNA